MKIEHYEDKVLLLGKVKLLVNQDRKIYLLKIILCSPCFALQISEMEIGLAVGGAFLSSALNVLFDRLAPNGDLLNMFRKHTNDL
ncbi:hypothetical protein H5410_058553 [Solanum commersonii]|uniref:Uncharacterized protein n=1 Tax=Solanum commersonii TaxID=4109 RepID=A0A9J5WR54_SOLCO|nr:hypothetical protein H5410_058553 [Solanum commersonii]